MKKVRNLRVLIGTAALATAGASAGFAIAAAMAPVGVQADQACEGAWLNGNPVVVKCTNLPAPFGAKCVPANTIPPIVAVLVCVPD